MKSIRLTLIILMGLSHLGSSFLFAQDGDTFARDTQEVGVEGAGSSSAEATPPTNPEQDSSAPPLRLSDKFHLAKWFRFGLEQRSRYEYLSNQVRGTGDAAHGLLLRTLMSLELGSKDMFAGFEFQDARAYLNNRAVRNTTLINTAELLQVYLSSHREGLLTDADSLTVRGGRLTIDLGSRRLLARNIYRNTINAFTGLEATWMDSDVGQFKVFATLPVNRLPNSAAELDHNDVELDEENFDTIFWGLSYDSAKPLFGMEAQAYVLGLNETDGTFDSKNRQLYTPGLRLYKKAAEGIVDGELELVGQFGRSRASAKATDLSNLDHYAWYVHAGSGYSFSAPLKPRVLIEFDAASGDKNPADSKNTSFDTLFGARRFEYGPTGLYGFLARSNMLSPGLKIEAKPTKKTDMFVAYRPTWVMSDTDAWAGTGQKAAAATGNHFLGNQIEWRARWKARPKNIMIDLGGAYFIEGSFAKAVNTNSHDPSIYLYSQLEFFL